LGEQDSGTPRRREHSARRVDNSWPAHRLPLSVLSFRPRLPPSRMRIRLSARRAGCRVEFPPMDRAAPGAPKHGFPAARATSCSPVVLGERLQRRQRLDHHACKHRRERREDLVGAWCPECAYLPAEWALSAKGISRMATSHLQATQSYSALFSSPTSTARPAPPRPPTSRPSHPQPR